MARKLAAVESHQAGRPITGKTPAAVVLTAAQQAAAGRMVRPAGAAAGFGFAVQQGATFSMSVSSAGM